MTAEAQQLTVDGREVPHRVVMGEPPDLPARTGGIDLDLGRVVLCTLPLGGEGFEGMAFCERQIPRDAQTDLAERYRLLAEATCKLFLDFAALGLSSVCIEQPGSGRPAVGLKLYGAFGAVAGVVPEDIAVSSMIAAEWKKNLGLRPKKKDAHFDFLQRHGQELNRHMLDEHHLDALCVALAWRNMQVAA